MTERPVTYSDIWQQYAEGKVSTCVMRRLLKDDEVFRAWCVKRAARERQERDKQAFPISEEDMA